MTDTEYPCQVLKTRFARISGGAESSLTTYSLRTFNTLVALTLMIAESKTEEKCRDGKGGCEPDKPKVRVRRSIS
jgi:hypothetical protein